MEKEEKKAYALYMAEIIWQSLFCSLHLREILCWGVSQRIASYYNNMPCLKLVVSGCLYKGTVVIAYEEGHDLFEVFFLDKNNHCTEHLEDVYADELGEKLNSKIERKENWTDDEYKLHWMEDERKKGLTIVEI